MAELKETTIDQLQQDDKNFNRGTERGKKLMEKSLSQFGAGRSILVDKDGRIIAGNKTAATYASLGKTKVRVIETTGDELIAVKRTDIDLDSKEGRELALADNATAKANLEWDEEAMRGVAAELDMELGDWDIELEEAPDPTDEQEAEEDHYDMNQQVETVCKEGDIWQLGNHRLMCGSSTSEKDMEALMHGKEADLWLTDPPYNVAVSNSQGMTIKNDNMPDDEFLAFLEDCMKLGHKHLKQGGAFYIWHADGGAPGLAFRLAAAKSGLPVREVLIWNKTHFTLGRQDYQWQHEPCLYGWKEGAGHYFINRHDLSTVQEDGTTLEPRKMNKGDLILLVEQLLKGDTPTTVISEKKPEHDADHPTMKPVKLIGRQVRNSSRPNEIVLDSFGGSGTTMIACEQLGRRCFMMELDPHYCDVIIDRWERFTGQTAKKINS